MTERATPAESQLEPIGRAYRSAFAEVQELLLATQHPKLPDWVFQLDAFDVVDIAVFSKAIARAEQQRRQWRAALHATTELAAIEAATPDLQSAATTFDPETDAAEQMHAADASMDAFISIVQYARSAGCSYVDGAFFPVLKGT